MSVREPDADAAAMRALTWVLASLCGCDVFDPAHLHPPARDIAAAEGGGDESDASTGDAGEPPDCELGDVHNCGACGRACEVENGEAACVQGECFVASCASAWGDCDGDAAACETPLSELANCGGCHVDCRTLPHAIGTCDGAECAVGSCESGFGDCDRMAANGCETALDSLENCRGCGVACNKASCSGGVCTSLDCGRTLGFGDCDEDGASCEADLRADAANCGSCGTQCQLEPDIEAHGAVACREGECAMDCEEGWLDCDADYRTGCEAAFRDTDRDGVPDCQESCSADPNKREPGVCGCGIADTDRDRDGFADCKDGCPSDPTLGTACFPYGQSNIDVRAIDFSAAPSATLDCGTTTVNTGTTPPTLSNWCGTAPRPLVQTQSGGPELVVIPLRGLSLRAGATLRLIGRLPVAFAVRGDVEVAGLLDASATGGTPGAGGGWSCGASAGQSGTGTRSAEGGGGGGGGYATAGGSGGDDTGSAAPGGGGSPRGNASLVPLYGGCGGGQGGGCEGVPGAGGGAAQISASGSLRVSGTIRANGGNGARGCANDAGGTGGGSGGAILLEGAGTSNTSGSTIMASGGDGGEGQAGEQGGAGSTSATAAGARGGDGSGSGGGGGGGGFGRIRIVAR